MRLDWVGYQFREHDGYGRFSNRLIRALQRLGVAVTPRLAESARMPDWMKEQVGIQRDTLTVSCLPPIYLQDAPSGGRHWLLSMTEGSELPDGWADIIRKRNIERVIVPCQHNAEAFKRGGVTVPIHVIPGGTDPNEFPMRMGPRPERPYTFLALADRGARKGWCEVWAAFYKTFGSPTDTPDVRLIIKARPESNEMLDMIAKADNPDPRVTILQTDVADMREVYAMADCFAIPSRSEGWGMPHREAAMMGLPVITQQYSGMDDGNTECWAFPLYKGHLEAIPSQFDHIAGQWMRADVDELAHAMGWCKEHDKAADFVGASASGWLEAFQTWDHSAAALLNLIQEHS